MKEYFDKWRQYVISEGHEEYAVNGVVKLYHYSPSMVARSVTLDPQRFVTSRRSWSRREYQTSTFPRIFFYLDKEKSEPGIGVGQPFVAEVDAMDIYDLLKDEEGLLKKSAQATGQTVPNFSKIFKALTGKDNPTPGYEHLHKPIREEGDKLYKGVSYTIRGGSTAIPVVAWFDEIEVFLEEPESNEEEKEIQ